jgi:hypothetical protein
MLVGRTTVAPQRICKRVAMAAMKAGLVPQQPPMKVAPAAMTSVAFSAKNSGPVRYTALPVDQLGQAGVGLDPDGQRGSGTQARAEVDETFNAATAVGTHDIGTGTHGGFHGLLRRGAHHGAVALRTGVEDKTRYHGQAGSLRRCDADARLVQIGEGLQQQRVGARGREQRGLFFKHAAQLVLRGFLGHQHASGRANRRKHQGPSSRRPAGDLNPGPVDRPDVVRLIMLGQLQARGAKGVGQNDPATRVDVGPRHRFDPVGVLQIPSVGTLPRAQTPGLELGTPGSVGDDGTRAQAGNE